ncbi:hypothetical protein NCU10476 [Neurospora crassa OR74A]|uniref:F-box domain-containing protein n=2 Tax=Neurospora crassa (strain ATCC 24698 / 74-OR23-1A / CBS 708.71 / DSM 1257 / FGSC 987) TaxID=367110 RepID=V5ILM4_NEUCR|nr:hypothetical protein NCU10476 [Neurospora crassa OR74A]ESA42542.1 hypothetical protein NCU10476 [Neurospora crassa OR74A]|eukprot:XP_011394787.1 hypothetical protein NCU10476 [Neurospora crassa OR74A]
MERYLIKKTASPSAGLKRKASDSPANSALAPAKRPQPLRPHESRSNAVDIRDQEGKYVGIEYDSWKDQITASIDQARSATRSKEGGIKVLGALLKAINACPCKPGSHGNNKACHISQCVTAVYEESPDALHRAATEPCSCGFVWPSCTDLFHIRAVDSLADSLDKQEKHVAAFSTALGLIRLDPAHPIGYCRVARLLRNLTKNKDKQTSALALTTILRDSKLDPSHDVHDLTVRFVRSGLYNMEQYRRGKYNQYHWLLRQLSSMLDMPESKRDPVEKLPHELLTMIWSHLDTDSLMRCERVSKKWQKLVLSDSVLWSKVSLGRPGKPGRLFPKFLNKHKNIRSLTINDTSYFKMTHDKLQMIMRGLPSLERLSLHRRMRLNNPDGPGDVPKLLGGVQGKHLTKLTHLSLNKLDAHTAKELLALTSPSLQVLDLQGFSGKNLNGIMTRQPWPSLRKLRLKLSDDDYDPRIHLGQLNMNGLMNLAPHLEELHIKGYGLKFVDLGLHDMPFDKVPLSDVRPWQNLQSLYIGSVRSHDPLEDIFQGSFVLPALPNLRSIEILSDSAHLIDYLFTTCDELGSPIQGSLNDLTVTTAESGIASAGWPQLEVFRCHGPISTSILRKGLAEAATNGSLKVLELAINSDRSLFNHRIQVDLIKDWAFTSSPSVHHIGLYHFNWAQHYSNFDGEPFIDWLQQFPNVDTVTVAPGRHSGLLPFIEKLITHPQIKALYFDPTGLSSPEWYEITEVGKKYGVKMFNLNGGPLHAFDGGDFDGARPNLGLSV